MLRSIEENTNSYFDKLSAVATQSTKRDMLREYARQFGIPEDGVLPLLKTIQSQHWSRNNVIALILSHSALFVCDFYRFQVQEVARWIGSPEAKVALGLDSLALTFGDLELSEIDRVFLGNPIWQRPLIKVGAQEFFCFLPQLFPAFCFQIFDSFFSVEEDTLSKYSDRRSDFLETEIASLFENAFGAQTVLLNEKWKYDGVEYETDCLVQIDSQLFIVEAKAHKVSWPALRGAPDRLKRHIRDLFVGPAIQSKRLEDAIREWQAGHNTKLKLNAKIDLRAVRDITRLSITLEDLAMILSNLKDVSGPGVLGENFPMAVTMTLADLGVVLDILDNPADRMFYLQRRGELQETMSYAADEIDLLGTYLQMSLDFGNMEGGKDHIIAYGMSKVIDDYFQSLDAGISVPKPKRRMTKWFEDIRDALATRKPHRWTEAVIALLSIDYDGQVEIERHFSGIRRKLSKSDVRVGDEEDLTVALPPVWRKVGFACAAFRKSEEQKRHAKMEKGAGVVFEQSPARRCLVLAMDVEGQKYPYATLAIFDRPNEPQGDIARGVMAVADFDPQRN
jgi:hypothetical protein